MIREITEAGRRDWLRLARTENVGPVTFAQLIERYGEASIALAALPDLARRGGRVSPLGVPPLDQITRELEAGAALGARLIASCEAHFPGPLAALDPPPPVIWALGEPSLLSRPSVAVVGAGDFIGAAICRRCCSCWTWRHCCWRRRGRWRC